MSKEQTPITAWEFYENSDTANVYDVMEQYAQAKVLEALEPQKELIEELLTIFDGYGVPNIKYVTRLIKEYYETQVKAKYE